MSSSTQTMPGQYSFASKEPRLLRAKADKLIAIFMPGGLLNAIVNEDGESIFIHYHTAPDSGKWNIRFFEETLTAELYSKNSAVRKKVFAASEKQLVVPEELYSQEHATAMFNEIYFKDVDETVGHYTCRTDKAQLLANINLAAKEAAERCLGGVDVMPVNYPQFFAVNKLRGVQVSCIITDNQAYCTLRDAEDLLWHQVFGYETAADVIFQVMHALRELKIDKEEVQVQLSAVHPGLYPVLAEIDGFFNSTLDTHAHETISAEWLPVATFIQQLSKCG